MCETSTIIPKLFISLTTSTPNSLNPSCSGSSVEESQISLLSICASVTYLVPNL